MKKILITGCGRSGTDYIATVLRQLGLDVLHEKMGERGIVDWAYAAPILYKRLEQFDIILHQVREPMKVMRSALTFSKQSWSYIHEHSPKILATDDPLIQVARYWHDWNTRAQKIAQWTYRVESLPEIFDEWCNRLEIEPQYDVLKQIDTNVNAQQFRPQRLQKRYKEFTWQQLAALDFDLTQRVIKLATFYGYDMTSAQEEIA